MTIAQRNEGFLAERVDLAIRRCDDGGRGEQRGRLGKQLSRAERPRVGRREPGRFFCARDVPGRQPSLGKGDRERKAPISIRHVIDGERVEGALGEDRRLLERELTEGLLGGKKPVISGLRGVPDRRALGKMVGQRRNLAVIAGVEAFDRFADATVEAYPACGAQLRVEGLAHQRVGERVLTGRPGQLHDQPGMHRLVKRVEDVLLRRLGVELAQNRDREHRADDRRGEKDAVDLGRELGESAGNHIADALRDRGRQPFVEVTEHLGEEQRVAFRLRVQRRRVRHALSPGTLRNEDGDLIDVEPRQEDALHRRFPSQVGEHLGQRMRAGQFGVAVGGKHHDGRGVGGAQQMS